MDLSRDELRSMLRELWMEIQAEQLEEWDRVLPFGDGIGDRWARARLLGFGEGTSVYDSSVIIGDVQVGTDTWFGPNTILDGSGGLVIGSSCSISAGVQIYTHSSVEWALSGDDVPIQRSPTRIGDRCYIGPGTIIDMGVEIGDGCVIGALSLVRNSIPSGSRAWGQPCTIAGPAINSDWS